MEIIYARNILLVLALFTLPQLSVAGNGCGTGWNTDVVRDSYGGASFRDACDAHDACYETCGKSKKDCDKTFRADMKKECNSTYKKFLEKPVKNACLKLVDGYYEAVKQVGDDAHKKAQSNCP